MEKQRIDSYITEEALTWDEETCAKCLIENKKDTPTAHETSFGLQIAWFCNRKCNVEAIEKLGNLASPSKPAESPWFDTKVKMNAFLDPREKLVVAE